MTRFRTVLQPWIADYGSPLQPPYGPLWPPDTSPIISILTSIITSVGIIVSIASITTLLPIIAIIAILTILTIRSPFWLKLVAQKTTIKSLPGSLRFSLL